MLASQGQALGCPVLQLQTCRLITQKALGAKWQPHRLVGNKHTPHLGTWRRCSLLSPFWRDCQCAHSPFSKRNLSLIPAHVPRPLQREASCSTNSLELAFRSPSPSPWAGLASARLLSYLRYDKFQPPQLFSPCPPYTPTPPPPDSVGGPDWTHSGQCSLGLRLLPHVPR